MQKEKAIQNILTYHEQTKHHPDRFAKGPGYMDWANEPNPFRIYEGAVLHRLPFITEDPKTGSASLYERQENTYRSISFSNIGSLLELSMGLSAWKSYQGSEWALRMNPSSGNLHPTEAHLILPPMDEFNGKGGIFHYSPYFHGLEQRAWFDRAYWDRIRGHFGIDIFFIALSSIHWRESWKYGERAFRYCNHDVGHAAACLGFAANLHGWKTSYLSTVSDAEIETMLGFEKTLWPEQEREWPDLLFMVHGSREMPHIVDLPPDIIRTFSSLSFDGKPNRLSNKHVNWEIINKCAEASEKPRSSELIYRSFTHAYLERRPSHLSAAAIIRQRRSAQVFDGKTVMEPDVFFAILDKTIPRQGCAPFDAGIGEDSLHLILFVHRVRGLKQGLYMLLRDERSLQELKQKCRKEFLWQRIEGAPAALGLYLLLHGDYRQEAATISCYQDIAGDSAFSLGMLGRFRGNIEKNPWLYRRLFWEAGMIGQVLYLEAEAHGLRGTGIGCYLDDMMHGHLGMDDDAWQDLYHFTAGMPVEDRRITTLTPYHHLRR